MFDRPASPARFSDEEGNELEFHQTALATPSCSPTLSFAYAQAYLAADVQSHAQTALNRFNASPATVCSPTPPPTPPSSGGPAGSTGQRAAALSRCKRKHKKALKQKKSRGALTQPVKKHLNKSFKKCKRKARRLPV